MISRSRATARAETWDSLSGLPQTPPSLPESPPFPAAGPAHDHAKDNDDPKQWIPETDQQQEMRQQCSEEPVVIEREAAVSGEASTGGRTRGRALAARAAERRRRAGEQEREVERELLVKRAEGEAERRAKR